VSVRVDAGVAAGERLHLAVLAVDDAGNGARVLVENASAVRSPAAPTVVVDGASAPATDPDGDGLYEDVDGDGTFNIVDVAVLLRAFDAPTVQSNGQLFDFNGDGLVNIVDVSRLLSEL
jgi:PKD repeat protein